ncbi:hypothetical protein [Acinetobacter towneri]|uniref:hypothetical protein n=1 Tax=Acinetobacter towneri TaxID=202956 RepID=UPI001CE1D157|nr:hypothetical protein [Acinetobacter towneri]
MYYLIKRSTLETIRPEFVTGGMGVDYRDKSKTHRYVTYDQREALTFNSVAEASECICRDYVVSVMCDDGTFKEI